MFNRKLAGLAAGALTTGVLALPGLMAPAMADEDVANAVISCAYNDWALDYAPTITGATVDGKVELSFSDFPGIAGVPAFVTLKSAAVEATATYAGSDITLTGSGDLSGPLSGGFAVPTVSTANPAGADGGELTLTGLEFDLVANAFGSDTAAAIPCTFTEPITVDVAPVPPAISCAYNDWALGYAPTITGATVDGKVELSFSDFPGIAGVPAFVTLKSAAVEATATYAGSDITLTGSGDLSGPLSGGFAVPTVSAANPAGANGGELTLTGLEFDLVANAFGSDTSASIPCTINETITVAVAGAEETPVVDPPVVNPPATKKAASTAKVTKVKYSKKTKKAKVSIKVTGKKGKATGKAKIVIKKGKKTVAKKVVKLKKNGKATWSKKITKKGKYKVTVKYTGSKTYKASKTSKAKTFKVK